jgi:hypothetical protein
VAEIMGYTAEDVKDPMNQEQTLTQTGEQKWDDLFDSVEYEDGTAKYVDRITNDDGAASADFQKMLNPANSL